MDINREKIKEIVEIFYQTPFRVFYVNSTDGENFSKPEGVFVSLGITTSKESIQSVADVLSRVSKGAYKTSLVEMRTSMLLGQHLNWLVPGSTLEPYDVERLPENSWTQGEAASLVTSLKEKGDIVHATQVERSLGKLESDGNTTDMIYLTPEGDYRIFYKKVNYRKDPDTGDEYRIGIHVQENS